MKIPKIRLSFLEVALLIPSVPTLLMGVYAVIVEGQMIILEITGGVLGLMLAGWVTFTLLRKLHSALKHTKIVKIIDQCWADSMFTTLDGKGNVTLFGTCCLLFLFAGLAIAVLALITAKENPFTLVLTLIPVIYLGIGAKYYRNTAKAYKNKV